MVQSDQSLHRPHEAFHRGNFDSSSPQRLIYSYTVLRSLRTGFLAELVQLLYKQRRFGVALAAMHSGMFNLLLSGTAPIFMEYLVKPEHLNPL